MVKAVKNICPKCKTAIEMTTWEKISLSIKNLFVGFGFIFIVYLALVGVHNPINDIVNMRFESLAKGEDLEMRKLMLNITDCDGADSYCYAEQLYRNVSQIRYVPSSQYDADAMYSPLFVYEHGGDCKNTANMYIAFLRSVGILGEVDCAWQHSHCVAVVPYIKGARYRNEKIVVDLTIPIAVRLKHNEDVWDYWEIYNNDTTGWRDMTPRNKTWSYQW